MKRGPKRTPTALRVAYSAPPKNGDTRHEVEAPPVAEPPACPAFLTDHAADMWGQVVRTMMEVGMLSNLDLGVLTLYCDAYRTFRLSSAIMAALEIQDPISKGMVVRSAAGSVYMNPVLAAKQSSGRDMARYAQMLGLTPSARASIALGEHGGAGSAGPAKAKDAAIAQKYKF